MLGSTLRKAIKDAGIYQYEASYRLCSAPSTLSRYLSGKATIPDEVLAIAIRELGCPELGRARCQECHIARAMAEVKRMEVAA